MVSRFWLRAFALLLTGTVAGTINRAILAADATPKSKTASAAATPVEFFEALKGGDIQVDFIAKNDKEANVLIKNNTKKPLAIKLPEAFAGVPVLAQNLNNNNNNNNNNFGGGNQGVGGGFGGGGGGGFGGGGGGGGGGFFNLAPEKQAKIEVAAVCLDHGKTDPSPRVKYEIRPLESYTQKAGVRELLTAFARGEVDQRSAQAAAWHLNNGLSWEELAHKEYKHANGTRSPYFTAEQLTLGARVAELAVAAAKQKPAPTPSATSSAANSK